MGCKKHSDWLRIQPKMHSESAALGELRLDRPITIWPKYDLGNYAMRITTSPFDPAAGPTDRGPVRGGGDQLTPCSYDSADTSVKLSATGKHKRRMSGIINYIIINAAAMFDFLNIFPL